MNRNVLFGLWCLLCALSSCNSTHITDKLGNEDVDEVNILIGSFDYEHEPSRITINENFRPIWEIGDTIGIFPTIGGQVEFPITNSNGSLASFTGGGWSLKVGHYYHAYYPFNFYNRNSKAIPISYLGQEQDGKNSHKHIGKYLLLAAQPSKSDNGESVTFTVNHMGSIMEIELTLPEPTTYNSLSVYTNDAIFPVKKTFDLQTNDLNETIVEKSREVKLNLKNITTTKENEKVTFYIVLPSVTESNYNLNVVIYDENKFPYTAPLYKSNGDKAVTPIKRNSAPYRIATPVLDKDFNMGVSNWGQGTNTQGSV